MIGSQINIRLLVAKMNSSFQYSTNAPRVFGVSVLKRYAPVLTKYGIHAAIDGSGYLLIAVRNQLK
jgi:hypothetical protein